MATLDKLCIQGVRAFSPHGPSTIEFFRPLTLIVGPNGSGKTTIIECLKFATTGELPPYARSGQAFVHDPKISNEVEVKAGVKLKFTSITGKSMMIAKNCQVRQKPAAKLEFKMLDSSLVVRDAAGVKQSHGYRCTDLDKETPLLLGVPKPILENVIFCHQEDSGWPLADAAQLKSRFDSIFATTRYSKALASLRDQVRDMRSNLRGLKGELSGCQIHLDYVQKIRSEMASSNARVELARKTIAEVDGEIADLEKRVEKATQKAKNEETARALCNQKEAQLREMVQTNEELYHDLSRLYTDSDEALRRFKAEFSVRMAGLRRQHEAMAEDLRKRENDIRKMEGSIGEQAETVTRFRAKIEAFSADCRRRDDKLRDVLCQAGLQVPTADDVLAASSGGELISEDSLVEAMEKLQQEADRRHTELAGLETRTEKESLKYGEELNELVVKCSTVARQIQDRIAEQKKLEAEAARLSKEIAGSGVAVAPGSAHFSIQDIEGDLKAAELSLVERGGRDGAGAAQVSLKAEIERKERCRTANEGKIGELSEIWKRLHDAAQRVSSVEQKRIRTKAASERIVSLIAERSVELEAVFGPGFRSIPHMSLQERLEAVIQERRGVHTGLVEQLRKLSREQGAAESQRRAKEEELGRTKEESDRMRSIFDKLCAAHSLEDMLRAARRKLKKAQQNHLEAKSGSFLYDGFVESAQAQKECPLCERPFDDVGVDAFTERVRGRLASVPELLAATEKKFTEASAYVDKLTAYLPQWSRFQALDESSGMLVAQLSKAERECSRLEAQNVELQGRLGDAKAEFEAALGLQAEVAQIRSQAVEIELLEIELAEESAELLGTCAQDAELGDCEKVSNQLDALRAENETVSRELRAMRRRVEERWKAEERVHALRERLARARVAERAAREQEAAERAVRSGAEVLERLRCSQPPLEAQRAAKQRLVEQTRIAATHAIKAAQESAGKLAAALASLRMWNSELSQRGQGQAAEQAGAERARRRFEEHKAKLSGLRVGVRDLRARMDEKSNMLASEEATERTIADNLRHRERKVAIAGLKVEIADLQAQLGAHDVERQRVAALAGALAAARARRAQAVGQQSAYMEDLAEKEGTLRRPENQTAAEKCFIKQVEVKETENGIADLERYIAALDRSLSTFHNQKMREINQLITEYWQATYRGQDIDTVEIRADVEKANRSFSYRVAMIKGETVLDMRGRCSSGQKVLACLIIRLALAETFGINCGILALDEPTTNLDQANVNSFANALVNIVSRRARQASFQLIVITHDEEFLEALGGQRQFCDHYYRVSKDDTQCSQIEKQRF